MACCWLMLPPLISPVSRIGLFNVGDFLHFVIENYSEAVADVCGGEVIETLAALARELKAHIRLAVLVGAGLGIAQDLFL